MWRLRATSVFLVLALVAPAVWALRRNPAQVIHGHFMPPPHPDRQSSMMFGHAIAKARNADVFAVSEPAVIEQGGRVFVYRRANAGAPWVLSQNITTNPAYRNLAGNSLAMSADGSTLVIGVPRNGTGPGARATSEGAVIVMRYSDVSSKYEVSEWLVNPYPPPKAYANFGHQVKLSEDASRLFVAANWIRCPWELWNPCLNTNRTHRGVYTYTLNGGSGAYELEEHLWINETLLFTQFGQPMGINPAGTVVWQMGYDMALYEAHNTLSTLINVWKRQNGEWVHMTDVTAPSLGVSKQYFGAAYYIDGNGDDADVYVGAPHNNSVVFHYSDAVPVGGNPTIMQSLSRGNEALFDVYDETTCTSVASWRTDSNYFGFSIDMSPDGRLLAIGAPFGIDNSEGLGSVYLYRRFSTADPWAFADEFKSTYEYNVGVTREDAYIYNGVVDEFGVDLALTNSQLIVAAKGAQSVYVYNNLGQYLLQPPPPPPAPQEEIPPPPPKSDNTGAIIGFVFGSIALVVLLVALFFGARWAFKRHMRKKIEKRIAASQAALADQNPLSVGGGDLGGGDVGGGDVDGIELTETQPADDPVLDDDHHPRQSLTMF